MVFKVGNNVHILHTHRQYLAIKVVWYSFLIHRLKVNQAEEIFFLLMYIL